MRYFYKTVLCGTAMIAAIQTSAFAQDSLTDIEAFNMMAERYAAEFSISDSRAKTRLAAMQSQLAIDEIHERFADTANGIYFDNGSDFALVVALPIDAANLPQAETLSVPALPGILPLLSDITVPVRFVARGDMTANQLRAIADRNSDQLFDMFPSITGIGYNEIEGKVSIVTVGTLPEDQKAEIRTLIGADVGFSEVEGRIVRQTIRGGSDLFLPGTTTFDCTAGFPAKDSAGRYGIITAGHCANSYDLENRSGANIRVTMPNSTKEKLDADADIQFMRHSTQTADGTFHYNTSRSTRKLTAAVSVGRTGGTSTTPGTYLCHNGANTGFSCGNVYDRTFDPGNICGPTGSGNCNNTYVEVRAPELKCDGGDSGGPWFSGSKAYGVHTAGPNGPGCSVAVYTSTDWIAAINVDLVFGG